MEKEWGRRNLWGDNIQNFSKIDDINSQIQGAE